MRGETTTPSRNESPGLLENHQFLDIEGNWEALPPRYAMMNHKEQRGG